jgi:hypothetical protein
MQGKQAKIISPSQERAILGYLEPTRYPHRDRGLLLLSMKAGLRTKAIASLTWVMVTEVQGQARRARQGFATPCLRRKPLRLPRCSAAGE